MSGNSTTAFGTCPPVLPTAWPGDHSLHLYIHQIFLVRKVAKYPAGLKTNPVKGWMNINNEVDLAP